MFSFFCNVVKFVVSQVYCSYWTLGTQSQCPGCKVKFIVNILALAQEVVLLCRKHEQYMQILQLTFRLDILEATCHKITLFSMKIDCLKMSLS